MSKFRTIVMYFVLLLVTLMMVFGISRLENRLDGMVKENHLRFTGQIKNAPPLVVFTTVALGSFRGLVADMLWLRAGSLQEQGNYFEMVQLARWITDLQPTFSGATAYLAWNMAYNISVTCSEFSDRWRWVNEGIKLIRDQALEYNPEDPVLYKDLAWIFQHKLGNIMDDANLYYKNRLAIQLMSIVGAKPDWEAMAAEPESKNAFLKLYGPDHKLWAAVKAAGFEDYDALYRAVTAANPAALPPALIAKLGGNEELEARLNNYFRAEYLRNKLKLEVREIVEIDRKYGKMDWRVPESQAIYWATMGLKRTPGNRDLSCSRVITQSLFEAFRSGRILMLDEKSFESIIVVPNLALIDSVYDTYTRTHEEYESQNSLSTFVSAKWNFMKEAISILYNYGKFSKADEYYKKLVKEEPAAFRGTLENFVMEQWSENVRDASVKKASDIISGLIFRSIYYLVYNDKDAALANERIARYIYNKYQADMGQEVRTRLPKYLEMKKAVVNNCIANFPPLMVNILKARIREEQIEAGEQLQPEEKVPDFGFGSSVKKP